MSGEGGGTTQDSLMSGANVLSFVCPVSSVVWTGMRLLAGGLCFWIFALGRPGGDLLSHVLGRSTIGAEGFHGRVRDGIGC